MNYEYTSKSEKQLDKLPLEAIRKIDKVIIDIEKASNIREISNIVILKGYVSMYRIKKPPYRVIVELQGNTILIKSIVKRNEETYKNL